MYKFENNKSIIMINILIYDFDSRYNTRIFYILYTYIRVYGQYRFHVLAESLKVDFRILPTL